MNRKSLLAVTIMLLFLLGGGAGATAGQLTQAGTESNGLTDQASAGHVQIESSPASPATAIGTGFSYQGRLVVGGNPASGDYDLTFTLFDAPTGGNQIGSTITVLNQTLSIGTFTAPLDFGASAFQGDARWLQISVRPAGTPTYTILSPRQALTPAPYALGLKPGAVMNGTMSSPILSIVNSITNNAGTTGLQVTSTSGAAITTQGSTTGLNSKCTANNCTGATAQSLGSVGTGMYGRSTSGTGVEGDVDGTGEGVFGVSYSTGTGVYGFSSGGTGTQGQSNGTNGTGVFGRADIGTGAKAVSGSSVSGYGGYFTSNNGPGASASSGTGTGMVGSGGNRGVSASGGTTGLDATGGTTGVNANGGTYGVNATGGTYGVYSVITSGTAGVYGQANNIGGYFVGNASYGVYASSPNTAVYATGASTGIFARGSLFAGNFLGDVNINGNCCNAGAGTYKIDDPADPANKYLTQAAVQSPDMMNIYNGNVTTDANGDATVQLPAYFQALDQDFRYQLTPIGQFAQAIISQEIQDNHFSIKTDKPNVKVSWQVTGVRHDPYAQQHPVPGEVDKTGDERGKYLYPAAYGQPDTMGVNYSKDLAVPQQSNQKP